MVRAKGKGSDRAVSVQECFVFSAAAMSSAGPTPSQLHATFLEVLSQLLSPSLEQRQLAEQQLQALQVTEGEA